jgi:nifR3 family TIM-barrel protein
MVPAVRVPVTIKMRTGFDDGDDDRFLQIAKIADQNGVGAITVHGRTRKQRFTGMSNHEAIQKVKQAVSVPVIGNGNIRCGKDAEKMIRETGCDGIMIARGALGNPWVYREVAAVLETGQTLPPPTLVERAAALREHFQYLLEFYGEHQALLHSRRVLHWFVSGVPGSAELRNRGNTVSSIAEFEEIVNSFQSADFAST